MSDIDDFLMEIEETLRAGDEVELEGVLEFARERWCAIREAGGDPAVIMLITDKRTLPVEYRSTIIKATEAHYYLHRVAHDLLTDAFEGADD